MESVERKKAFSLLIPYSTKRHCYSTGLSTGFCLLLSDNYHRVTDFQGGGSAKNVENAESGEKVLDFYVQIDVRNGLFLVYNRVCTLITLCRPILLRKAI